ncbi:MAG: HAMP domain-containing protein [Phycisphaeraceae bacterium]|nr:MAG: HAMP domain-containing protein [Phycisphaeraceae bacterium]
MVRTFRALLRPLEVRLFVPLSIAVALVIAIHAVLGFNATRDRLRGFVRDDAERCARLIDSATHDGMLLNRLDDVQATLERLGRSPEFTAIRIYDKDGKVVLASDAADRGVRLPMDNERCLACHATGEALGESVLTHANLLVPLETHDENRCLAVIRNEPSCSTAACHVHPADKPVLGVLEVGMTMAPFEKAVTDARTGLLATTIALIVLSGLVAGVFIRKVVHEPVSRLQAGTQRIARGDLDTLIEVRGDDELTDLARAFNNMVVDLREARVELNEWSRTLEQKVDAKSRELEQAREQMVRVETMASLGKLAATVAHEINNPLGGILTYARLVKRELAEQPVDPSVRAELERCLTLIDSEAARCGGIIHNMLAFARGRASTMQPIDINEIVERSLMLINHHLEMRGVTLETSDPLEDPILTADPDQLQQALLALLMNALEAMPTRGGVLILSLKGDDNNVEITVADSGCGIPAEALSRIFEPFYSTKTDKSGVGLGLAVVYGIIQAHNGMIDVDSEPGVGTTFHIVLPREQSIGDDRTVGDAPADAAEPTIATHGAVRHEA